MNRAELQRLARKRLREAKALLTAREWEGAYYLAGYAAEFGLKACILAYVERSGVIFEDRKYAEKCWTHDLRELLRLAQLDDEMRRDTLANPILFRHWETVKDWSELSRYQRTPHYMAKKLYTALTDKPHGVMPWIMNRW